MEATFEKYIYTCKSKNTYKLSSAGYTYSRRMITNGAEYFYCDKRKICSASYVFRNGTWARGKNGWDSGHHLTHSPNFDRTLVQLAVGEMKKLAIGDAELTTAEIISKTSVELPIACQLHLPHEDHLKRSIRYYRTRNPKRFEDPKLLIDVKIPSEFSKTIRGNIFLTYDSEDFVEGFHNKLNKYVKTYRPTM